MELIVSRKRAENGANSIVVVVVVVVVVGGGGEGRKKRRQTKSERKTNEKRDNKNTSTSAHASASTCVLLPLMKTQMLEMPNICGTKESLPMFPYLLPRVGRT